MKRAVSIAFAALVSGSIGSAARADDKALCFAAASRGQSLRNEHKLVEARAQFRVCARLSCPAAVAKDCGAWLEGVEQGLPTVVVTAKDGAGKDLVDVQVTVDGKPFIAKLDGEAVPLDPGNHVVHVTGPDGTVQEEHVLVREGAKNRNIAFVLGAPPLAPTPPPPALVVAPPPPTTPPPQQLTTPAPEETHAGPWQTVGWIAAAVGVVGLGVGTGFGIKAISDKNDAHCDASGACDAGPLGSLQTSSTISTFALIGGSVFLAGGSSLILVAPRARASTARLEVAPRVGTQGAGLTVGGSW